MTMSAIATNKAPQAIGPYVQALVAGGFVFCSGQLPLDPGTGQFVAGDVSVQTRRVLANLAAVLEAAGSSLSRVVKTTVYLADMGDFAAMNGAYGEVFGAHRPARSTVQAARLPRDAQIEIDAIAALE